MRWTCPLPEQTYRLYGADGRVIAEAGPGVVFASGVGGQYIVADGAWGEPCQRLIDPDGPQTAASALMEAQA